VAYALLQGMKSTRGAISPVLAERGLHPGQDLMLSALWREDGITQAELARAARHRGADGQPGAAAIRAGGVRAPGSGRGRSRRVYLTEEGQALRRPVEQAWRNADRRLRRRIGPDDLAALRRILGRLTSS